MYNVGFIPSMYVSQVMCENKEKRQRSARRNYQRIAYEFAEEGKLESFGEMLDTEMELLKNKNYERNLA